MSKKEMACDVAQSVGVGLTSSLVVQEETVELFAEHDLRRNVVNKEFMVLYGNDPAKYLPPLPQQERPKSSLARAWAVNNPAMRQLGNAHRRGPRQHLPGSANPRKPALISPELRRPQTAYNSHVKGILACSFDERRPRTTEGKMESLAFRQSRPLRPASQEPEDPKTGKKLHDLLELEMPEPEPLLNTPAGGMRRPGRYRGSARRSAGSSKGGVQHPSMDKQRLDDFVRLLRGDVDFLPADMPTTVRIILAGSKQDFTVEREALHQQVLPELREYAESLGLEFELIDMGIDKAHVPNIATHVRELHKAKTESVGPFYIHLSGNYCPRPQPPPEVPAPDFDSIHKMTYDLNVENRNLLDVFYKKDENSLPPKYILQHEQLENKEDFRILLNMWQNLLSIAEHAHKISQDKRMRLEAKPVNEHEIDLLFHGTKVSTAKALGLQCLSFCRNFTEITTAEKSVAKSEYLNIPDEEEHLSFDHDADKKITKMQDILTKYLPEENVKSYNLPWTGDGVDCVTSKEHKQYLEQFVEDFKTTLKLIIKRNYDQWVIKHKHGHLYAELLEQAKLFVQCSRSFGGRTEQLHILQSYFKDTDMCKKPFVINGPSGVGKTALMCAVGANAKEWIGKSCVCVIRCLGITHNSCDVTHVLVSLCLQICAIYNMDSPPECDHSSVNKMANHFKNTLELVAKHHASRKPLLVLLDGLEKLKPIDRADTLFWLPLALPRHVYLMVSANSTSLTSRLHKCVDNINCFIELGDFDCSEVDSVFDMILRSSSRKVTQQQEEALLSVCDSDSNPLFVKTLAIEASNWHSGMTVSSETLPQSTTEAISRFTYKLEEKFGIKFIQKLMSYLCLLGSGISERELCDLMCSDQEVLHNIVQQKKLEGDQVMDVFEIIHHRLMDFVADVRGVIVKVHEHGRHLLRWTCEKYRDTCSKKYFGATNPFTGKNDNMDDTIKKMNHLFSVEKPFKIRLKIAKKAMQSFYELKCETMPYALGPMNSRKLHVLPSLISHSGSEQEFCKQLKDTCLCNYSWLLAKLQCLSSKEILHDFDQVTDKDHEIDTLRFFLHIVQPSLQADATSLALQLLGSMPYLDEDYPLLNQMLMDCQTWIDNAEASLLIPVFPFFPSALELCRVKIWNLVDIVQIDQSDRLGVMRNENGYAEIWDLENYELVHSLGVRYDRVSPNVFCNKTHVLAVNGADLVIWEIESGIAVHSIDLEKLLKEAITSMYIFCHTNDFEVVAVHMSDEDFNQSIAFVHVQSGSVLHKLSEFDVKDEFFKRSAIFNEDGNRMVFVMARSTLIDDKKNVDYVKLKVFDLENMSVQCTLECGEKKFNNLLLKDNNYAIVSWSDCSFDVYDIMQGKLHAHLSAPDSRLAIEHCALTRDNYLVGLSSSLTDVDRRYYALWFWNMEEQTSANLLSQSFEKPEEIPKHFVIIEELHIAVLSSPDTATLAIWDLPNSECIFRTKAHIGSIDNMFKTKDPYQIYTCSATEEVIKLWDIYEVIRKAKEDKVQKSKTRSRSDTASLMSNQATRSILNKEMKAKKAKKELRKSKSVRFADDESIFSEDVKSTKSEADVDNGSVATNDANDLALIGNPGRDEYVIATQVETMQGATWTSFSQDGTLLILSTDRSLPTMWEMTNGHVIKRLEPHDDHDIATPWAELACEDKIVVGLSLDEHSKNEIPTVYKYNVWDLNSGEPMHKGDLHTNVTVCSVSVEREKIVLCCLDELNPADNSAITFRVVDIKLNECLQEARYSTPAVPTTLQLMDDFSYAVTDHMAKPGEHSEGFTVYHIEVLDDREVLEPAPYQFKQGTKHKQYRATQNVILPGGQVSVSTGLNGDLQVWDVTSREYEGNLYSDPHVKDTRNPSLHNHGSKRIHDMAVSEDGAYLICGGGNGSTSVWDLENEVNIASYHGHTAEVVKVAISNDNQLVFTAGNDMVLNVWKFSVIDRPLCRLFIHSTVTCMHISSDNKSVGLIGQRRNEPACFMLFQVKNAPEPIER